MKLYIQSLGLLLLCSLLSCNTEIRKFQPDLSEKASQEYNVFFNKEIKSLKREWKELYSYLKKGHVLKHDEGVTYVYSYELYRFLKKNLLKIYETPYLQDYNNLINVFGEPSNKWELNARIRIVYFPSVVGDPCQTCQHDGFGYVFDAKTYKILKE